MNQYTSIGNKALTYDVNGNLKSYNGNSYEYDSENRLKKITTPENVVVNYYDAMNRRIKKSIFDTKGNILKTIKYLYNGDNVLCEYDEANNEKVRYVNAGLDKPVRRTINGSTNYYYHLDVQNNITDLSDSNGNLVESYSYDVYGKFEILDADGNLLDESITGNEYFFAGRRYEEKSELYYYRARFYSPVLGRFLQPDPIGYGDGLNIYAYCKNNPVNFIDPMGLCRDENDGPNWWEENVSGPLTNGLNKIRDGLSSLGVDSIGGTYSSTECPNGNKDEKIETDITGKDGSTFKYGYRRGPDGSKTNEIGFRLKLRNPGITLPRKNFNP